MHHVANKVVSLERNGKIRSPDQDDIDGIDGRMCGYCALLISQSGIGWFRVGQTQLAVSISSTRGVNNYMLHRPQISTVAGTSQFNHFLCVVQTLISQYMEPSGPTP
jgi:hypothetical protein